MIRTIEGYLTWWGTALSGFFIIFGMVDGIFHAVLSVFGFGFAQVTGIAYLWFTATGPPVVNFSNFFPTDTMFGELLGYYNAYFPIQSVCNYLYYTLQMECTFIAGRGCITLYKLIPLNG